MTRSRWLTRAGSCRKPRTGCEGAELLRPGILRQGDRTVGEGAGQDRSHARRCHRHRHRCRRSPPRSPCSPPAICSGEPCSSGCSSCSTCSTAPWPGPAAAERGTARFSTPPATASPTARSSPGWPGGRSTTRTASRCSSRHWSCLVTSQVISYAKARAEASGLSADGGLIERPDRLVIVLVGAGLTGIGGYWSIDG